MNMYDDSFLSQFDDEDYINEKTEEEDLFDQDCLSRADDMREYFRL